MPHDLRAILRLAEGKQEQPTAAIFDGRTMQSTPESGERAGYDGHKKRKGSKIHLAVDTLGYLLALHVTPANEQERVQVQRLAEKIQEVPGIQLKSTMAIKAIPVKMLNQPALQAGIELMVVKLPEAKKSFVLIPRQRVVERSIAWTTRFRRLARDFERTPKTLAELHFLTFLMLMLPKIVAAITHLL